MQEVDEERIIKEYQDTDGPKTAKKVLVNHDGKKYRLCVKFADLVGIWLTC
jgi:hypothetical protein